MKKIGVLVVLLLVGFQNMFAGELSECKKNIFKTEGGQVTYRTKLLLNRCDINDNLNAQRKSKQKANVTKKYTTYMDVSNNLIMIVQTQRRDNIANKRNSYPVHKYSYYYR